MPVKSIYIIEQSKDLLALDLLYISFIPQEVPDSVVYRV